MKQVSDIKRIAASGTMLTLLLICMLPLAFNIQPTTCEEFAPLHFGLKIWPEHPTVHDQVNVTVMFSDVPSISYGFVFDSLIQVDNGFSVNINVSIPLVILYVYAGNVTHTYELGKLSEGSYNFSATVHYRLQQLDGSWQSWPFDGSYSEAFAVSPSARASRPKPNMVRKNELEGSHTQQDYSCNKAGGCKLTSCARAQS